MTISDELDGNKATLNPIHIHFKQTRTVKKSGQHLKLNNNNDMLCFKK